MNKQNNNFEGYIEQIEYYKARLEEYENEVSRGFYLRCNKNMDYILYNLYCLEYQNSYNFLGL